LREYTCRASKELNMTDESRDLAARYYFSALFSPTAGPPSMSAQGAHAYKAELPFEMEGPLLKASHL
jgi:hypothetical protein